MAKRKLRRDKRGRFVATPRKFKRPRKTYGGSPIALPKDMSPAFRKYTKPVAPGQRRVVYAFVEVESSPDAALSTFDFLAPGESSIIPVKFGRFTRGQLAKLTLGQVNERLRLVLPGVRYISLRGFGHSLTRLERKGMRFDAPDRGRKTRKKRTNQGHRPTKARSRKRRSNRRI